MLNLRNKKYALLFMSVLSIFMSSLGFSKEFNQLNEYKKIVKNLEYIEKHQKDFHKKTNKISKIEKQFSETIEKFNNIVKTNTKYNQLDANTYIFSIYNKVNSKDYLKEHEIFSNFLNSFSIEKIYENNDNLIKDLVDSAIKNKNFFDIESYIIFYDYLYNSVNNNINESDYKTSIKLREKIDVQRNIAKENYGNMLYEEGMKLLKNSNNKKSDYRKAYEYFKKAKKYLKNNEELEKILIDSKEKGFFSYSIVSKGDVSNFIKENLKDIAVENNNNNSDINIIYNENISNTVYLPIITEEEFKHTEFSHFDFDGKVYKYKKITTTIPNKIRINFTLQINSKFYNNTISDYIEFEYPLISYTYVGDVPKSLNVENTKSNSKNKTLIREDVNKKIIKRLTPAINNLKFELLKQ